jgi:DNA-binding GntR family transcriptional regulator
VSADGTDPAPELAREVEVATNVAPAPGRSSCPARHQRLRPAILDALTEPLGQSELARRSGVPPSTLKNAVKRLETAGHVEKVGTQYRRRVVA